ncbi:MAG TPA: MFS transporter [Spongiibacteraceae bacterium]|jgi:MFS family permease|nr:MFS transporter [Spongiibacteraceae bacterium]HUH37625.1 MFS transporter [Spongiibacteraceae bacterium]
MHYGWYIVASVFTAQLFLSGFFSYGFSLFVEPIEQAFSASRTEVMYSMTFATVVGLLTSPLVGSWVDRYSPRWLLTAGAALLGGGLWLIAHSQNIYQFALIFGVSTGLANLLLGPLTGSTTISRWFSANRGRALGISAAGTSVGGMLVPWLIAYWLNAGDWRSTMQNLSYCVLLIVLPMVALLVRAHPQTTAASAGASGVPPVAGQDLSFRDIVRHRGYWAIGLTMGLLFCVYSALLAHLSPYATGLGANKVEAARLIMVVSACGLFGKLVFGFAADRINLRTGLWIAIGLVMVGLLILAMEPSYTLIVAGSAVLGLAAGGMLPIWGALLAVVFGLVSYGRVMGLMTPLITVTVMPGFTFAGWMFDLNGGYRECFLVFVVLLAGAALLLRMLQLPAREAA